jgi:hypothetical protein
VRGSVTKLHHFTTERERFITEWDGFIIKPRGIIAETNSSYFPFCSFEICIGFFYAAAPLVHAKLATIFAATASPVACGFRYNHPHLLYT